jgi:hypothetical protein
MNAFDLGLLNMGFNSPSFNLLILAIVSALWFLDQKGFNSPDNKALSLDLVSSDKGLPFLNSAINFLDSSESLNPNDDPARGLRFKVGLYKSI